MTGRSTALRTIAALAVGLAGCGAAKPPQPATEPIAQSRPTTKSAPPKNEPRVEKPSDPPVKTEPDQQPAPTQTTPEPQPVFRPDDQRPAHDDQKLADLGIRRYDSKRLRLYTDIDPAIAATLPPVIDQAYQALTDYFGPLPPSRDRSEFQMTGYLIKDDALFREVGLIPGDLPPFEHGRHRRNEFWMREQKYDYYRRHLLIHEVTHCFMTVMPDTEASVWYMEGMAECFGTHRMKDDGSVQFRVMPTSPEEFAGSGRITAIRNDVAAGKGRGIPEILDLKPVEFLKTEHYAWSWGLSTFLETHPRYRDRFQKLGGFLQRNAFPTQFFREFDADSRDIATEWSLFVHNLQYGYDTTRAAIDFRPGTPLNGTRTMHQVDIQADRGWQSSGVLLREEETYVISASGRFVLGETPEADGRAKPWTSEPQGISFRYFGGRPIGQLMGCIRTESGDAGGAGDPMLKVIPIGRQLHFKAPATGTLYLRLNDDWSSLHDNRGQATVEIRQGME